MIQSSCELLIRILGIRGPLPLIQAPMAGGLTGAPLVAAVGNEGCLGSVGAGYMHSEELRKLIHDIRATTKEPFSINLMVPGKPRFDSRQIETMLKRLAPYCEELGIALPPEPIHDSSEALFEKQLSVVLEEDVPVVSFVFGIPKKETLLKLREKGVRLIGTATTVEEGMEIEAAGMDAVVAQGGEAGGHRGTFIETETPVAIELRSLVSALTKRISIPVIAAGGIMDGEGVLTALAAGASGVQMGTAFLTTFECGASEAYKTALLQSADIRTVMTRTFSGKWAQGLCNRFTEAFGDLAYSEIPDYPIQNGLTAGIRKAAVAKGESELLSLWAGTGHGLCRRSSVAELIRRLYSAIELSD